MECDPDFSPVTRATSERLATGPCNAWGFRLRHVTHNGNACRFVQYYQLYIATTMSHQLLPVAISLPQLAVTNARGFRLRHVTPHDNACRFVQYYWFYYSHHESSTCISSHVLSSGTAARYDRNAAAMPRCESSQRSSIHLRSVGGLFVWVSMATAYEVGHHRI